MEGIAAFFHTRGGGPVCSYFVQAVDILFFFAMVEGWPWVRVERGSRVGGCRVQTTDRP